MQPSIKLLATSLFVPVRTHHTLPAVKNASRKHPLCSLMCSKLWWMNLQRKQLHCFFACQFRNIIRLIKFFSLHISHTQGFCSEASMLCRVQLKSCCIPGDSQLQHFQPPAWKKYDWAPLEVGNPTCKLIFVGDVWVSGILTYISKYKSAIKLHLKWRLFLRATGLHKVSCWVLAWSEVGKFQLIPTSSCDWNAPVEQHDGRLRRPHADDLKSMSPDRCVVNRCRVAHTATLRGFTCHVHFCVFSHV